MKDRNLIIHRLCDLAKQHTEIYQDFKIGYCSVDCYSGFPRVQMSEEGFLEMFPDATGYRVRRDGRYELETTVDGICFFALTDEVAP